MPSVARGSNREWQGSGTVMSETAQFVTQFGVLVLFVVVFVEQVGLPVPAIPVLVAAGALAGTGRVDLWLALGVTVFAALAADWIWYELGRRQGRRVLTLLCRIALEADACIRRTEAFFTRHGPHSLVVAKFIPGLSTIAPPLAGVVGLAAPAFLFYDALGAVIWAGSSLGLGYAFSDQIERAVAYAEQVAPVAMMAVAGALVVYIIYKARARRGQLKVVPRMTVAQLTERLKGETPPLLIDVRSRASAEAEPGIPLAWSIPVDELIRRHRELPRDRDLVLYCDCPEDASSAHGALLLHTKGFTRAWPLAGGLRAWRSRSEVDDRIIGEALPSATVGLPV